MNTDQLILDKALWRPRDAKWLKAREKEWAKKEKLLANFKSKKGMAIIKRFYLRGTLPDWSKVNARWDEEDLIQRHLDLFTLLWLCPDMPLEALTEVRDSYVQAGFGRVQQDVAAGFTVWNTLCSYIPCNNGTVVLEVGSSGRYRTTKMPFSADVKALSSLMCGAVENAQFRFGDDRYDVPVPELGTFAHTSRWLRYDELTDYGTQMSLQYDEPFELMREVINAHPDDVRVTFGSVNSFPWALSRFNHFETGKEGPGVRSDFVKRVRKSLNEDEWPEPVLEMWRKVVEGELKVDKLWP